MPLWPGGEGAAGLDNVSETVGTWHIHHIDVCFAKRGAGVVTTGSMHMLVVWHSWH
jgi:hypothetical protein